MNKIIFKPFEKQKPVLRNRFKHRAICAAAGKRAGKTEIGALWAICAQEEMPNFTHNGIDPYLGVIVAPTNDMLTRLSWKKFQSYAKPCGMIKKELKSPFKMMEWHNSKDGQESLIYGVSADRPERIEGIKANWIWIDEVFQVTEQMFLECLARTSDSNGFLLLTGSLGVQHINPKQHWVYKYFKEKIDTRFKCFEWGTSDNPHYPKEELEANRELLDAQTFKAMYEISWDVIPRNAVYSEFSDNNIIKGLDYNPSLPVFCCVDWGWTHPMAIGIFQIDKFGRVFLIREKVQSKLKIEDAAKWIVTQNLPIQEYICDIAGTQEREQTGLSNVRWFKIKYGIRFKYRTSSVVHGVTLVRRYIKNANGKIRFFVSDKCPESIDGIKRYKYPEKDGKIQNENPSKEDDDAVDMIRYFFMYKLDDTKGVQSKEGIVFE